MSLNFEILQSTSSWLLGSNPNTTPPPAMACKGGTELRACNSQPSEPFITGGDGGGGLKAIEAHLMTLVCAKKALTLEKKHKKHSSPSKKSKPQKKSIKKHNGAFKSTCYDPCTLSFTALSHVHMGVPFKRFYCSFNWSGGGGRSTTDWKNR